MTSSSGGLGRFRVVPFGRFEEEIRAACGADLAWIPPRTVRYLKSYLTNFEVAVPSNRDSNETTVRGAATLVVEDEYVDRHFLEEFTAYYAALLSPPPSKTRRIHVFNRQFGDAEFQAYLERAAGGELKEVQEELGESYLGCLTVRPIPSAPVGRTLLKTYVAGTTRSYQTILSQCRVRIAGMTLTVPTLPFLQQDLGVGACATAALWAALSKATRAAGMRAPTPYSVTKAATRNLVNDRHLPATSGLDLPQMAQAIRDHGLEPLVVKVQGDPDLFVWTLKVHLQTGLPAVLFLGGPEHAVTVSGFRSDASSYIDLGSGVRTGGMSRVYVHDDRIGPYVRMCVRKEVTADGYPLLKLQRLQSGADKEGDAEDAALLENATIRYAIYPTYPKMRLSGVQLADVAGRLRPLIRLIVGPERDEMVTVDGWFEQNGDYLTRLLRIGASRARVARFVRALHPSRYIGVLRWTVGDALLADVLCDATDIPRDRDGTYREVLGFFFYSDALPARMQQYASMFPRAVIG